MMNLATMHFLIRIRYSFFFLLIVISHAYGQQKPYYVSSSDGNDANDGRSPSKPWKTLDQVNSVAWWGGTTIQPGDSILFKCGDKFYGMLKITLNGTSSKPVILASYGSGAKPLFDGNVIPGRTWTAIAGRSGYYKLATSTAYLQYGWEFHDGAWEWLHTYAQPASPSMRETWLDAMPRNCTGHTADSIWIRASYTSLDSAMMVYESNEIGGSYFIMRDLAFQNYWIGISIAQSCSNAIFKKLDVKYIPSVAIKMMNGSHNIRIDSCTTDSTCYTAIYNYIGYNNVVSRCTVSNVMDSLRWGIFPNLPKMMFGGEKCAIGSQASDYSGYGTGNGNTWEYNVCSNIFDSGYDAWWNINDTVQYNTFTNIGSKGNNGTAIWLMGEGYVIKGNTVNGCNGIRINNLGGGVNSITDNILLAVPNSGYGIQVGSNGAGGSQVFSGNNITGLGSSTQLISFEADGNMSAYNVFNGSGKFGYLGNFYSTLASFHSATGYEDGSTMNGVRNTDPNISISASSHDFGNLGANDASDWTYSISGLNLTPASGAITVTASGVYKVSKTTSGGFASSITIPYTDSALSITKIYVNFVPIDTLINSGNITNECIGATTRNISVTGKKKSASSGGSSQMNYFLEPPYPNPTNGRSIIEFVMPNEGYATLKVFDILGREITTLAQGIYKQGTYRLPWNIGGIASGVYYCKFTSGSYTLTRKMMVIR